jgi:hypothetical protein
MTDRCVMTPPPELVREWASEWMEIRKVNRDNFMAAKAAQWGADAELDACGEWLRDEQFAPSWSTELRAARRPKPPSLKEQALDQLDSFRGLLDMKGLRSDAIRRALEALPND